MTNKVGVALETVVDFLDTHLEVDRIPDFPHALNGLQVQGSGPVRRVALAVDASQAVINLVNGRADLLIVHHGLFWGGLRPLTGPNYRRVKALIDGGIALYSVHLPLDLHSEVGNSAILARRLGFAEPLYPFGDYKGTPIGWCGKLGLSTDEVEKRLTEITKGPVRTLNGGPDWIAKAGVVTGAGASTLTEAAEAGLDAIITGEAQHHHAIEAKELGVTVFLGGHYATETFGVQAVGKLLEDKFGVESFFVDSPTGL